MSYPILYFALDRLRKKTLMIYSNEIASVGGNTLVLLVITNENFINFDLLILG